MQYSTRCIEKEISANGIEFEKGSVYDRLGKLTDLRKAKGKRYSLDMLLMIIMMAKLCGENTPMEIAEWAQHRKGQLMEMLQLKWSRMPHHNTYRRVLAEKMYADEIERLVGEYNQSGDHGTVYAMDGKAMLGKRRDGETGTEYLLSVYDVEQAKVMSQV
ncbi:MAG: transposase family protein, partial [Chloroflexi bacterium]|nr:transposase family protein [Chloroflexota bacterium]